MSSNNEEPTPSSQKKRRILRACDNCKRRKSHDPLPPHTKCPGCVIHNVDCTYDVEPKKRGRPDGYVSILERRIQLLEVIVKKLCPDKSELYNLVYPLDAEYAAHLTDLSRSSSSSFLSLSSISQIGEPVVPPEPQTVLPKNSVLDVIHKVAALTIQDDPFNVESEKLVASPSVKLEGNRMWGKSSGVMFMQTAMSFKKMDPQGIHVKKRILRNRRPIFWEKLPWYIEISPPAITVNFPPSHMITQLVDVYFEHVNLFYPLLHRPTFENDIASGLHFRDEGFARVLLLVCAVGSRYMPTIDERATDDGTKSPLSAGWKWFNQVQIVKPNIASAPTLYDLQVYCLAIQFLTGCSAPHTIWLLAGYGIRLAQDVDGHQGRVSREKLTKEDELWKRAFWVLIAIDRMVSMAIGRPCAIFDDLFDLDMPIECDDEYWDHPHPAQRFKQPEGLPSTVSAFSQHLRMTKIVAFAMSTVYSIKAKFWDFILHEWDHYIVAELDSAMNNWLNSLPEHLRWDPNQSDDRFFKLSGSLISVYYYVQILIHRPYIRETGHPSPHSFPSLAICTNAARSCAHVLDHQMKRGVVYPYMLLSSVTAVLVLILNMWGNKHSGVGSEKKANKEHIDMCMNVLRKAEERWYSAGALIDMLNEFTSTDETDEYNGTSGSQVSGAEFFREGNTTSNSQSAPTSHFTSTPSNCPPAPPTTMHQETDSHIQSNFFETSEEDLSLFEGALHDLQSGTLTAGQNIVSSNTQTTGYNELESLDLSSYFECDFPSLNMTDPVFQEQAIMDSSAMNMWMNAPTGFEINEWNTFFSNFTQPSNQSNADESPYMGNSR